MMKKKIILVLVFLLSIMPIYSKPISFRMKGAFQRGCPRMPSITKVEADYEDENIAMKKIFEIEIKSNVYGRYNPQIINPLCEMVTVDFDNLHWFENKSLRVKYIYNKENKVAFSVYDDEFEGDYVLDDYGLRDWFDANCPYKSVALGTITRNCKIIGL